MLEANLGWLSGMASGGRIEIVSADPAWSNANYGVPCVESAKFPEAGGFSRYEALLDVADRLTKDGANRGLALSSDPEAARLERLAAALRNADALVVSGGGNLCSTWPHLLYERIALMHMARNLGKKILLLGQTIGPALHLRERALLLNALRAAQLIVLRETQSYALLRSADIPSRKLIYDVDDAFSLAAKPSEKVDLSRQTGPWIAVTLTAIVDPEVHPGPVDALAEQLKVIQQDTGADFVYIPHVGEAPGTLPDLRMGEALAKRLDGKMKVMDRLVASEVRWLTGQASMIISNRYHPLVFGLAANVPSVGLYADAYTKSKIEGVLEHASLQQWALPLQDSLRGQLASHAVRLWRTRDEISARLHARQRAWRDSHQRRWMKVAEALKTG